MQRFFLSLQPYCKLLLLPFSFVYAIAMFLRRKYYEKHNYKALHKTISIGNIAWGGTGKTPLLIYLLKALTKHNIVATTITRGYKAKPPLYPFVVTSTTAVTQAGDEPLMVYKALQHITTPQIIVDYNRIRAIQYAQQKLHQSCFLLDDAMQHLTVHRDINIVLLRPVDLTNQWNMLIPAGSWREPQSALKSASLFCIKCTPQEWQELLPYIEEKLLPYGVPIYSYTLAIEALCRIKTQEEYPATHIQNYSIVTGLGNPTSFYSSVTNFLHTTPYSTCYLVDHANEKALCKAIAKLPDIPVICSEKDAIKLQQSNITRTNIYYTKTTLIPGDALAEHSLEHYILEQLLRHT